MTPEQQELVRELIKCIDEGERVRDGGLPDYLPNPMFKGEVIENQLFIPVRLLKDIRKAFNG